jgi:hypothetical protein
MRLLLLGPLSSSSSFLLSLAFALILISIGASAATPSDDNSSLDLRAMYPLCPAWSPYSQGACGSCCAAAVATIVAAHECIEYGRASHYSMAQIWDCASEGTCAQGGSLLALIDTIGDNAGGVFLPSSCAPMAPHRDSNRSQCSARFAACPSASRVFALQASLFLDLAHFSGPSPDLALATHALMHELLTRGPVIAVLRLVGQANIAAFRAHEDASVFAPAYCEEDKVVLTLQHCIVIYGWGVAIEWDETAASHRARPFWRVQNSYGSSWGTNGTGRILRGTGLLEGQWRSLHMAPNPCVVAHSADEKECGRLPYANYSTRALMRSSSTPPPSQTQKDRPDNWAIIGLASGVVVLTTAFAGLYLYRGDTYDDDNAGASFSYSSSYYGKPQQRASAHPYYHPFG